MDKWPRSLYAAAAVIRATATSGHVAVTPVQR
jgi:hypothetical protein